MKTISVWACVIGATATLAYSQGDSLVSIVDPPDIRNALDVYASPKGHLLTVDVMVFAAARVLGRAVDRWESIRLERLRTFGAALAAMPGESEGREWLRVTGQGALALLAGWPADSRVRSDVEQALRHWQQQSADIPIADRQAYAAVGEDVDERLAKAMRVRLWLGKRLCQFFEKDGSTGDQEARAGTVRQFLEEHPDLEASLRQWDATITALMSSDAKRDLSDQGGGYAFILRALDTRITTDNKVLDRLSPEQLPGRTYCGGLDMLALGPLASAYGQSVWRRFERLAAAQDVIKGDGFAATSDSVYDRLLTALGFLSQDPAEWAQGFTQSDLWRTRILQTQLASWACVRRSVARYTTVHIYGGRSDASPRILVDPYPLAFGGLASAMRKAKDCLGALLGDDETASDLADLASDLDVLREVANGGVDAARQHSRPLARIVDGLGVWFGNGTMGDEEVLLAAHPQGQLYIGIGIPRRLVVRLRVDGDLVSYEGAVMSYRERWEGVPIVVEQPGGGVDWNVYDWGGRASGRREGR